MVDTLDRAADTAPVPPRGMHFGRVALVLALLPVLGAVLYATYPPGWGASIGSLYALLIFVPPVPALVLAITGLFRDQRKWTAGAALAVGLLPFAYIAACG